MTDGRRRRAKGEASRQRILEAAAEVAGERGYEGTSIALISERSGLPASSIYWHFEDKDQLVAAVIEESYERWVDGLRAVDSVPEGLTNVELLDLVVHETVAALQSNPDFLRLGLMLMLDQRPDELSARAKFREVRTAGIRRTIELFGLIFPDLAEDDLVDLARITVATADGLFIAGQMDEDGLNTSLDVFTSALLGAAAHLREQRRAATDPPDTVGPDGSAAAEPA